MSDFDDPAVFRTVLESLQTGIYVVDANQKIVFWNEGAEKITGYLRQDVLGHDVKQTVVKSDKVYKPVLVETSDALLTALRDGKPAMADLPILHKAGHRIFVRVRAVPIRNAHGSIIGAAESFEENPAASEWDRRQNKLADYGCLDAVSGVLSQSMIQSHLRESLATFSEHQVPFSILNVAVDNLEHLRKMYGLGIIAPILRVVAQTIENSLRPTDFLGRSGENEFLAILTECAFTEVGLVAERLRKMVSQSHVQWWGKEIDLTASFGAASLLAGDDVDSIVKRAQQSLQHSTIEGGDRVTVLGA
jgi:diguanylate cyclase (GGDEF)-like protein/PAS domain S-box-containing protein